MSHVRNYFRLRDLMGTSWQFFFLVCSFGTFSHDRDDMCLGDDAIYFNADIQHMSFHYPYVCVASWLGGEEKAIPSNPIIWFRYVQRPMMMELNYRREALWVLTRWWKSYFYLRITNTPNDSPAKTIFFFPSTAEFISIASMFIFVIYWRLFLPLKRACFRCKSLSFRLSQLAEIMDLSLMAFSGRSHHFVNNPNFCRFLHSGRFIRPRRRKLFNSIKNSERWVNRDGKVFCCSSEDVSSGKVFQVLPLRAFPPHRD